MLSTLYEKEAQAYASTCIDLCEFNGFPLNLPSAHSIRKGELSGPRLFAAAMVIITETRIVSYKQPEGAANTVHLTAIALYDALLQSQEKYKEKRPRS